MFPFGACNFWQALFPFVDWWNIFLLVRSSKAKLPIVCKWFASEVFLRAPPKASMQNMWELPKIWKCPIFYKMQNTFFTQGSLGVLELIEMIQ